MKKLILTATAVSLAIVSVISCNWFSSKPKKTDASIVGSWKVDSIYSAKTDTNNLALLVFAMATTNKDSLTVQFNADSTFTDFNTTDSLPNKYYVKSNQLFVNDDSTQTVFDVKTLTDSSLVLYELKDSTYISFSRLK